MSKKKLTVREQRFAKEMANPETKSQAEAARKAGYSPKTAKQIAAENLTKPYLLEAIEQEKQIALQSAGMTKEIALGKLAQLAFASIDLFTNANGAIDWKKAKQNGALKAVRTVKETTKVNGDVVREITLNDPIRAISEIASFAGWKQEPAENKDKLNNTIQAIRDYLDKYPDVDRELVISTFGTARGFSRDTIIQQLEGVQ